MPITIERRLYECRPYTIDHLGYVRCGACFDPAAEEMRGRVYELPDRDVEDPMWMGSDRVPTCDTCNKPAREWPIFTNTGTVTIEHVPCRIF